MSTEGSPIITGENNIVASPVVDPAGGTSATSGLSTPAPEPTPAPADASSGNGEGSTAPAPEPTPDPKTVPDWIQKRINELTAKRYEAERLAQKANDAKKAAESRAADLLAQIAKGTPAPAPDPNAPKLTEEEIERRAQEKAIQIARAQQFNTSCDAVAESGKKEFTDWDQTLTNLAAVGLVGKNANPEFLETAVELKNSHKILHLLGNQMDEAARIAALPPKKMALELARIEAAVNAPPAPVLAPIPAPLSQAPAPVIPVIGAAKPGAPQIDDPNLDMAQWAALRAQQVAEKRNRYNRS